MKKIELLAPAGGMEAFRAAVENGADAVYLGGSMFSARQNADNFTIEELKEAVDYAHQRRVRVYVAVNTLVSNEEVGHLIPYLYQLAQCQVDAVIVQDLGVAGIIRQGLPQMELHASTQMAVHNSQGIKFLEERGFSRVVLAREVSFENIKLIRERTSMELETFVHGALCICFSGQCLMSSMIGGRSGNRGHCAQPCRMKYSLVEKKGKLLAQPDIIGEHLLSPRDLKMIEHIPELVAAGITSLKIEGRMKRPEYVATVVRNYREAIDSFYQDPEKYSVAPNWEKELEQIFNRDFTTGYFFNNQGKDLMSYKRPNNRGLLIGRITKVKKDIIWVKLTEPLTVGDGYEIWVSKGGRIAGELKELFVQGQKVAKADSGQEVSFKVSGSPRIGDRVFKTHDTELIQKARESYLSPKVTRKIDLFLELDIEEGKKIKVKAEDSEGYSLELWGDFVVEKAQKHPLSIETLQQQLNRLGNTPFQLARLKANICGEVMVPVSELNQIRRNVVEGLLKHREEEFTKNFPDKKQYLEAIKELDRTIPRPKPEKVKPLLSVTVGNPQGVQGALEGGADLIYLNWVGLKNKPFFNLDNIGESIELCHKKKVKAIIRLPRLVYDRELDKLAKDLRHLQKYDLDGLMAGNLGALNLARQMGFKNIYGDYPLNIFNDYTIRQLLNGDINQVTLSPELTLEQIKKFSFLGNFPLEIMVHGNFPLMISEHCVVGSVLGNKNSQNPCKGACAGIEAGLKDRMNFIFPLVMDNNCRMLVYNTKPLNLYKDLKEILTSGINTIRIEGRKENARWIKTVTQIYRKAIEDWVREGNRWEPNQRDWKVFEDLEPAGYTTGHYFRGVL